MSTSLLNVDKKTRSSKQASTGVTWRFHVLYERRLDLLAEEKLLEDGSSESDLELLRQYKATSLMYRTNTSLPKTRPHRYGSLQIPNGSSRSSSILQINDEFPSGTGSASSINTSVGASRSFQQTQGSFSVKNSSNMSSLFAQKHLHGAGLSIEEEIMPSA